MNTHNQMKGCGLMTQVHFSVKALIIKDNQFLAIHKCNATGDFFDLPGGKMKANESSEETLRREVKEETNLSIASLKLLDTWQYVNEHYLIMGVLYACEIAEQDVEITLSPEHDYYEWLPLSVSSATKMKDSLAASISHLNFSAV